MACRSEQTFAVVDNGPCGKAGQIKLNLSQGFNPGMVLTVVTSTHYRAGFNIADKDDNWLLHANPRIDQNRFNLNSWLGAWGSSETPSEMPIKQDVKYCLHIVCESDGYRLFVNGEELYFYRQRSNNPATLFIVNDHIYYISYKINEPKWAIQQVCNGLYVQEFGCGEKETPYEMQLQGCNTLSWIIISGIINSDASRVFFNLNSASGDIIFHYNPRFTENCVVRNSRLGGHWGKEETSGSMVFQKNQKFILAIDVEDQCYKTYFNGVEHITYNHREPADTVTKLQISNYVTLYKIMYQK